MLESDDAASHVINEPQEDVIYDGKEYEVVREGLAEILSLKSAVEKKSLKATDEPAQSVFYNPIQQFNRDLSVLAIRAFGEDLSVIRKARHQRRVQELAKKGPKGKKRKRGETDNGDSAQDGKSTKTDGVKEESDHRDGGICFDGHASISQQGIASNTDLVNGTKDSEQCLNAVSNLQDQQFERLLHDGAVPTGPRSVRKAGGQSSNSVRNPFKKEDPQLPHGSKDGNNPQWDSFRILDALSATGLRALRYSKETSATSITANDLSSSATASIKLNIRHNNLAEKVHPITGNALHLMYEASNGKGKYDVIDLDPYGTAAPFLDAAVQALNDGGLLCVTCTDAGVFASAGYPEKTTSQYGGLPFKGPQSHEGGLRLILHAIATSAARYSLAMEPLLSLSVDFYARIFVRIRRSPAEVKFLAGKTMLVYNCDAGCGAWSTQPLAQTRAKKDKNNDPLYTFSLAQAPVASPFCEHCGFKTHLSGPMWGGPLHNPYFIQRVLDELPSLSKETYATLPRIDGMLSVALHETILTPTLDQSLTADRQTPTDPQPPSPLTRLDQSSPDPHPFFLIPSTLAKVLHCVAPSDASFCGALLHLGYRVARSHTKAGSIRTDAPWHVIWEVMREWVRQKAPIKPDSIKRGTAGWGIMRKERSKMGVWALREEVMAKMEEAVDLETLRREVESVLGRVGQETRSGDGDGGDGDNGDVDGGKAGGEQAAHLKTGTTREGKSDTSKLKIVFDEQLGRDSLAAEKKLVRYQINPRANWGPMTRAKGGGGG
ncbi:RNA methyltransferase tRNA(m5U54)methyltransferase [Lignoscripta atroalba]|nr:RNA methyltransferase tRNA(m5U54)methyltransferase [Lignoscripta atroalba]